MTDDKVILAIEKGGTLRVKLVGVTFPCVNGTQGRQTVLRALDPKLLPIPVTLVYDDGNVHDSNAVRVDLISTGEDLGYLPRNGEAALKIPGLSRSRHIWREEINTLIRRISGVVSGSIVELTGGYNPRVSAGAIIEITAVK